jgi:GTP cyclohydrolase I
METICTSTQAIEDSIKKIFWHIGENPDRPGLTDTPTRIMKMWKEIFRGYDERQKPKITTFQNGADGIVYDEMIVDTGNFYSMCEHHMMPFFGTYHFAYIPHPEGKIIGLSKVARIIDYCSARLQIQERLASDVVQVLSSALECEYAPLGMAIVLRGEHLCKTMRGVKKEGLMTAAKLTGLFKDNQSTREEFYRIIDISD